MVTFDVPREIYIYTIANSHIKVTDSCYLRNIHPTTSGYETTEHVQSSCKLKRVRDKWKKERRAIDVIILGIIDVHVR